MATFKDGRLKVKCPLCLDWLDYQYVEARKIFVFACRRYNVAIAENDSHLDRWEELREKMGDESKIPCLACDTDMRIFTTSKGYLKAVCPKKKCGASIASGAVSEDKTYIPPRSILHKEGSA